MGRNNAALWNLYDIRLAELAAAKRKMRDVVREAQERVDKAQGEVDKIRRLLDP